MLRDFEMEKNFKKGKKGKFSINRAKAKQIVHTYFRVLLNYLFYIRSDSNVLIFFLLDFILMFFRKGERWAPF